MRNVLTRGALAAAVIATPALAGTNALSEWNLIVRTNVTSSSEVDGSALIGGNLSGTSNYAVQGVTALNGDGLAIGGNVLSGNIQVNNGGNLRLGGANSGTLNINGGSLINDASVATSVSSIFSQLELASAYLASLPANGTVDGGGNMNASPVLLGGQNVAIYNISAAAIQSLGGLNLNFGSADSVIINVTSAAGVVDLIAPPNIIGGFNQANSSRILWNMPDATSLLVNNSFNGAVIAPFADLVLSGGGMNGAVAVNSISAQNAEIRNHVYNGYFQIPAPGAASLLGIAGLVALRRRR
jgi:choice-of-anchor A domain-containing protein